MIRRGAARDQEYPHVLRRRAAAIKVTPAEVVQGVRGRLAKRAVHPRGEEAVDAGALVDFVEVHDRLTLPDDAAVSASNRWSVGGIQGALHEVARREQVLQPLLILDPDCLGPELVRQSHRRKVRAALPEHLRLRELRRLVLAEVEAEPLRPVPVEDFTGLGLGYLGGSIV